MKITTIIFPIREELDQRLVLLAMKKRGFGAGKWNGFGGKLQNGESVRRAAVRELRGESGLIAEENALRQIAFLKFYFDNVLVFECHAFVLSEWKGHPRETPEMGSPTWYQIDRIPYKQMWVDDEIWLPKALSGKQNNWTFYFDKEGEEVLDFKSEPTKFEN